MLARTEFKLRFFGSVFGYVWTLVRPLMFFGVLLFVFTESASRQQRSDPALSRVPARVDHPVHLLSGNHRRARCRASSAARTCCARSASRASWSRCRSRSSRSSTSCMNLIVVFIFILASGVEPLLELARAAAARGAARDRSPSGVGMLLSALYVRFRDIQPIWEVISQILFYALADPLHGPDVHEHAAVRDPVLANPRAQSARRDPHAGAQGAARSARALGRRARSAAAPAC